MTEITKGMVVQLISGGPKMSVENVGDFSSSGRSENGAVCVWFDSKNIRCQDTFDVAVLKKYVSLPLGAVRMSRG